MIVKKEQNKKNKKQKTKKKTSLTGNNVALLHIDELKDNNTQQYTMLLLFLDKHQPFDVHNDIILFFYSIRQALPHITE
jgi:hypothetical protein